MCTRGQVGCSLALLHSLERAWSCCNPHACRLQWGVSQWSRSHPWSTLRDKEYQVCPVVHALFTFHWCYLSQCTIPSLAVEHSTPRACVDMYNVSQFPTSCTNSDTWFKLIWYVQYGYSIHSLVEWCLQYYTLSRTPTHLLPPPVQWSFGWRAEQFSSPIPLPGKALRTPHHQKEAVECNTHKQDSHTLMYDTQKEEGPVTFSREKARGGL